MKYIAVSFMLCVFEFITSCTGCTDEYVMPDGVVCKGQLYNVETEDYEYYRCSDGFGHIRVQNVKHLEICPR